MSETPKNRNRCGWCITGDHERCCVTIELSATKGTVYNCPCSCNTTGEYSPANRRTRCLECGRRDVEVGPSHKCANYDECQDFIAARRAKDPQWQALQVLDNENRVSGSPKPVREPKSPKEPKPAKGGRCRCCDGPTKGGLFLPGHDARYISQQAELIVGGRQDLLVARLDDLSPALFVKLTKRVDTIKADRAKQPA